MIIKQNLFLDALTRMKATRRNPIHIMNKMLKFFAVVAFAFSASSCCGHHWHHHHAYNAYPAYNYGHSHAVNYSHNHAPAYGSAYHGFAAAHHRR